jgi:hypothetical protein
MRKSHQSSSIRSSKYGISSLKVDVSSSHGGSCVRNDIGESAESLVARSGFEFDALLGLFERVIRASTYLIAPLRIILFPRQRRLFSSFASSCNCSSPRRQKPPNPLNPLHRTLQPLQPLPLLTIPPLQHHNPFLQLRPRLSLRSHHLISLLE